MTANEKKTQSLLQEILTESVEALVFLLVIHLITERSFEWWRVVRIAILVGVITALVRRWNPDVHGKIKEGMTFQVGSSLLVS